MKRARKEVYKQYYIVLRMVKKKKKGGGWAQSKQYMAKISRKTLK